MGVIYFLIYVRKHESNLPTNICATAAWEENTMIERKMRPFKWNHFPAWFITAWCVFFYQSVCFFPLVFIKTFIATLCFYGFWKTVLVKKIHTLPRCGLIFPSQMPYFLEWLESGTLQQYENEMVQILNKMIHLKYPILEICWCHKHSTQLPPPRLKFYRKLRKIFPSNLAA